MGLIIKFKKLIWKIKYMQFVRKQFYKLINNSSIPNENNKLTDDDILKLILKIASILRINRNNDIQITRYMSIEGFNAIYKEYQVCPVKSSLRLYSASGMNDKMEGDILYNYLFDTDFHNKSNENAFIASFTQNGNDAMQMWQTTYAKGCKGISYSFNTEDNILGETINFGIQQHKIEQKNTTKNNEDSYSIGYYKLAYHNKNLNNDNNNYCFRTYLQDTVNNELEVDEISSEKITSSMKELREALPTLDLNVLSTIQPALLFISHLVKDITWNYENEVRVIQVLQGNNESDKVKIDEHNKKSYYDTEQAIEPKEVVLSPKYNPARLHNNNQHIKKLKEKNINFFYLKSDEHNISKKDDRKEFFNSAITTVKISEHVYNFGAEEQEYKLLKEELK